MLNRSLRLVAASVITVGSAIGFASAAHAQSDTTTAAAAETTAPAAAAETTVPAAPAETTPAAAATETTVAPAGGVAAGGGFLSQKDGGLSPAPFVIAVALVGGAGTVLVRRRRQAA